MSALSSLSRAAQSILTAHKFFVKYSFNRLLGCTLAEIEVISKPAKLVRYKQKVIAGVCDQHRNLSVSSATAIFDELSTVGFMAFDKSVRWGVSVHLETKLFHNIEEGEEIILDMKYTKIGKTLGFCDLHLFNANNPEVMVGKGRHIKFLPVSWLWDNYLSSDNILPVLIDMFYDAKNDKPTALAEYYKLTPPVERRAEYVIGEHLGAVVDSINMSDGEKANEFLFIARKIHLNPGNGFHGGCAAVAAEEAFIRYMKKLGKMNEGFKAKRINLQYLSAIKASSTPIVVEIIDNNGDDHVIEGNICQNGFTCVSFAIDY